MFVREGHNALNFRPRQEAGTGKSRHPANGCHPAFVRSQSVLLNSDENQIDTRTGDVTQAFHHPRRGKHRTPVILPSGRWCHGDQLRKHREGACCSRPDEDERVDRARWTTTGFY